jgi:four helix bundle protein
MAAQFDHEKLDVYRLALEFVSWIEILLTETKRQSRETSDQLDRASLSILLNIAEGNGKNQPRSRANFFAIARGSATECAACLDALAAKRICTVGRIVDGKALLIRIVAMLTKLIERFGDVGQVKEDFVEYGVVED